MIIMLVTYISIIQHKDHDIVNVNYIQFNFMPFAMTKHNFCCVWKWNYCYYFRHSNFPWNFLESKNMHFDVDLLVRCDFNTTNKCCATTTTSILKCRKAFVESYWSVLLTHKLLNFMTAQLLMFTMSIHFLRNSQWNCTFHEAMKTGVKCLLIVTF